MRGTERVEPSFVPFDIVFSDIDIVEPDLLHLSDERAASALTPLNVKGLPELWSDSVEGHAPAGRDAQARALLAAGVSEYSSINPDTKVVRVYRHGDYFARPIDAAAESDAVLVTRRCRLVFKDEHLVRASKRQRWLVPPSSGGTLAFNSSNQFNVTRSSVDASDASACWSGACSPMNSPIFPTVGVHRDASADTGARQFSTSVIVEIDCAGAEATRNRWPSGDTAYICRLPPVGTTPPSVRRANRRTASPNSNLVACDEVARTGTDVRYPSRLR